MENYSRHNSGAVSHIQLKLGTGVDYPSGVTWHDSQGHTSTQCIQQNVPLHSSGWSYPLYT